MSQHVSRLFAEADPLSTTWHSQHGAACKDRGHRATCQGKVRADTCELAPVRSNPGESWSISLVVIEVISIWDTDRDQLCRYLIHRISTQTPPYIAARMWSIRSYCTRWKTSNDRPAKCWQLRASSCVWTNHHASQTRLYWACASNASMTAIHNSTSESSLPAGIDAFVLSDMSEGSVMTA